MKLKKKKGKNTLPPGAHGTRPSPTLWDRGTCQAHGAAAHKCSPGCTMLRHLEVMLLPAFCTE